MRDLIKYEENYISLPFEENQIIYRRKKILESIDVYRPKTILEIGCGLDPLFNYYKSFNNFVVVEPSAIFFQSAISQASGCNKISVYQGLLEDKVELLKTYSFDFIVLSSLLHEINSCENILKAVHSICRDDTVVHINVPNARSFHRLLAYEMGIISSVFDKSETQIKMQQSHTFDIETLIKLVQDFGFSVKDSGTFFIKPFTHSQMKSLLDTGILNKNILDGLFNMSKYIPDYGSEIFMNVCIKK